MFELVNRKEWIPLRNEINDIIFKARKILDQMHRNISFRSYLIGSDCGRLVTRIKETKMGYELEYLLILNHKVKYRPSIRSFFFESFREAIEGSGYSLIEDSSFGFTIKKFDSETKDVLISCYFRVVWIPKKSDFSDYFYSRYYQKNNSYVWVRMKGLLSSMYYDSKFWDMVESEFLTLKNNNPHHRLPYSLYLEAIRKINPYRRQFYDNVDVNEIF